MATRRFAGTQLTATGETDPLQALSGPRPAVSGERRAVSGQRQMDTDRSLLPERDDRIGVARVSGGHPRREDRDRQERTTGEGEGGGVDRIETEEHVRDRS